MRFPDPSEITGTPRSSLRDHDAGLTGSGPLGGLVAAGLAVLGASAAVAAGQRRRKERVSRESGQARHHERFGSAVELLASDRPAARLGGCHALAGLADDWDAGRQTCIDVLCSCLRMPYEPPADLPARAGEAARTRVRDAEAERALRRAVVDIIGERLRREPVAGRTWHGHRFRLVAAVLDGGDLRGIRLTAGTVLELRHARFPEGIVEFDGARLEGGTVDLTEAGFDSGTVSFDDLTLAEGLLNFRSAFFHGGDVSLRRACFAGGTADFGDSSVEGSDLCFDGAVFTGSRVDFDGADLVDGCLRFADAGFAGGTVDLTGAEFSGATVDFSAARPPESDAQPVRLPGPGTDPTGLRRPPEQG